MNSKTGHTKRRFFLYGLFIASIINMTGCVTMEMLGLIKIGDVYDDTIPEEQLCKLVIGSDTLGEITVTSMDGVEVSWGNTQWLAKQIFIPAGQHDFTFSFKYRSPSGGRFDGTLQFEQSARLSPGVIYQVDAYTNEEGQFARAAVSIRQRGTFRIKKPANAPGNG
jgi:hypothetical protein